MDVDFFPTFSAFGIQLDVGWWSGDVGFYFGWIVEK